MEVKNLLPIGSVVVLKDGEQKLMIYGIAQMDGNQGLFRKPKHFDYVSVPYPQGNMGPGSMFLFNHDDIQEIFFRGYEDEERKIFLEEIEKNNVNN